MKAGHLIAATTLASAMATQGALVYSDNFNRSTLEGGSYTYTTAVTASSDGVAGVVGNELQLSNDGSAAANASGRVYVTTPTSAFSAPYSSQLDQNAGLVTWTFNMQQIRADPSGFNSGSYGAAFVLGATSADLLEANGYAVVLGNAGSTDPIRLVSFNGGLDLNSQLTDVITAGSPLDDPGDSFLSLSVSYNPTDDLWSLYGRNDGTAFSDPTSGSLTFAGSNSDDTYTGTTLGYNGVLWNHSTAGSQTAHFDNFSITAVPEPAEWGLISALGLLGVAGLHSWRNRQQSCGS